MKQTWFKKAGWFYLPIHAVGMLITLAAIVFTVAVCVPVLKNSQAAADDPYEVFAYTTCIAFWWKWIAEKTAA